MAEHEKELASMMRADAWRMDVLRAARSLALPDGWVGAGFVRALVWDILSGHADRAAIDDVDVVYHDSTDISEESEKAHDASLARAMPGVPWSCKNQARMHLKAGLATPYADTADGLCHWTETATAVAVRLDEADDIRVLAPFGLDDLFGMVVRPTPFFREGRMEPYRARLRAKKWESRWPRLVFED